MKILFVDDEALLLSLYKEEITYSFPDIEVFLAEDGALALKLCQEHEFEIVFTDGNMPILDGFGLIAELQKINYQSFIVLVTGHHKKLDEQNYEQNPFDLVIFKPFDYDRLIKIIEDKCKIKAKD